MKVWISDAARTNILNIISLGLLVYPSACLAHEDFDLGISELKLNEACHPVVTIKNLGTRPLPHTFYLAENPAHIEFRKPHATPAKALNFFSKPLNKLDKNRALKQPGGSLRIEVPLKVSENPAPLEALLIVQGEFWDYGQTNDQFTLASDCVVGKGMTQGDALPQAPADLSLTTAAAAADGLCTVNFRIENLNKGRIQNTAYDTNPENALVISAYERRLQKRLPSILLKALDPGKTLLSGTAQLGMELPKGEYTISLWQAQGDGNFANNHRDVIVNNCPR